jgi:hypothetical protein
MTESIPEILAALRAQLERRSKELNASVRAYPSPIARCDDQLPRLLDQRDRAARNLRLAEQFIAALELDEQAF